MLHIVLTAPLAFINMRLADALVCSFIHSFVWFFYLFIIYIFYLVLFFIIFIILLID